MIVHQVCCMNFYPLDSEIAGSNYYSNPYIRHHGHHAFVVTRSISLICCLRLMMSQSPWTYVESVCLKKSRLRLLNFY
jgi:hypothetical protein